MQESAYPAGAVALPRVPSKKPIVAALVALLVGAGITAGVFLLTDGDTTTTTRTIVSTPRTIVSTPVSPGEGTVAKDEAATAAAVGSSVTSSRPTADHVLQPSSPGAQHGTSPYREGVAAPVQAQVHVNPSTDAAKKNHSQNAATDDYAQDPLAPRYDGGPEEGTRGPGIGR